METDTMTKTIEVHARRWFQKTYGNTYHSVRVIVDGETVGVRSDVYGYGDHYLHTAGEVLIAAGFGLSDAYDLHGFRYDTEAGAKVGHMAGERFELTTTVEDVARKRDLLPSWWVEDVRSTD